jgi:hypothetical protein
MTWRKRFNIILSIALVVALALTGLGAFGFTQSFAATEEDSDGDGVPDVLEEEFGSDVHKADTDGDGLTDQQEIFLTMTDPTLADTDGNSIADYDEDPDSDGLSNGEEMALGTDPLSSDSDVDDLDDGDELTRGTDPLLEDTDSDGAWDGWEVQHRYDPLVSNATFKVEASDSYETLAATIATELTGEAIESLTIEPAALIDTLLPGEIPGYLGVAFDLNADEPARGATLSIELDASLTWDNSIEPTIYYFDETTQLLKEIPTEVLGNVATAKLTHFSKYVLMDKKEIYEPQLIEEIDTRDSNNDGIPDAYLRLMIEGELRVGTGQNIFEGWDPDRPNSRADWDGDGLLNGEEIKITEKDAGGGRKSVTVAIVSNPFSQDTDGDTYDDSYEVNTLKTDPSRYNELFYQASVDEVTSPDRFIHTRYYRRYQGQGSDFSSTRFFNETVGLKLYAWRWNMTELCKDELKEYLGRVVSDSDAFEDYHWQGVYSELMTVLQIDAILAGKYADVTYDAFNASWHRPGGSQGVARELASQAHKTAKNSSQVQALLKNGHGRPLFSKLGKAVASAGYVLEAIDLAVLTTDQLIKASEIEANLALYQAQVDLLEFIQKKSDDKYVQKAAKELIAEFKDSYSVWAGELGSLFVKAVGEKGSQIAVGVLLDLVPFGWAVSLTTALSNGIFHTASNVMTQHKMYTIGSIGVPLAADFTRRYGQPFTTAQAEDGAGVSESCYVMYRDDDNPGSILTWYSRLRHLWIVGEEAAIEYSSNDRLLFWDLGFKDDTERAARTKKTLLETVRLVDPRLASSSSDDTSAGKTVSTVPYPDSFGYVMTLVVDVSGSMNDRTGEGTTKLDAAKRAGDVFVNMTETWSQQYPDANYGIGIVQFSGGAETVSAPHIDYPFVRDTIAFLGNGGGTNIAAGLDAALTQINAVTANDKIIILMTDGLDNNHQGVLDCAQRAVDGGIRIFAVGFGSDVDSDFLEEVATAAGGDYQSADTFDGTGIVGGFMYSQQASVAEVLTAEQGVISQGETSLSKKFDVPRESGDLNANLYWPGSELDMILVDPNGDEVDADYPGTFIDDTVMPSRVTVEDPLPGTWSMKVYGADVPQETEPYYAIVSFKEIEREGAFATPALGLIQTIEAACLPTGAFFSLLSLMLLVMNNRRKKAPSDATEEAPSDASSG